ncbi:fungal-specific transcription factor domain-containing protein [Exophiala viscosa]|uniref:Fungal-specific transcription factor domain-containing protein n=1 Tax=Exophiala viscosa TaxID=2486360 RepID=A0AAN6IAI9_9EURO|nr:fungal-specific transcription factor domain-containing protein [Exophiala viscosa]
MEFRVGRHNSNLEDVSRTERACRACHSRKIRCDLSATRRRCTNCAREPEQQCRPWKRRKKAVGATGDSEDVVSDKEITESSVRTGLRASKKQATASSATVGDGATTTSLSDDVRRTRNRDVPRVLRHADRQPSERQDGEQTWSSGPLANPQPFVVAPERVLSGSDPPITSASAPTSTPMSLDRPYEPGHMQRSRYIAPDSEVYRSQDGAVDTNMHTVSNIEHHYSSLSPDIRTKICNIQETFALPDHPTREALFENFWTYCYPWDPVLERSHLVAITMAESSPLLVNAILLAGSRMSSSSSESLELSKDFYNRAKTLFYLDFERDPLKLLTAVSLLHWFNPHGPETVSSDTSTHWVRVAVSLAQQTGLHRRRALPDKRLRRRIWWTLVARDCLISAAHGRPAAINLEDCDVPRPTVEDFPVTPATGVVFIAYVDLAVIVGRFVKAALNTESSLHSHATGTQESLSQWITALPRSLRLTQDGDAQILKPYSFEARQLHVLYYVAVVLLYRERTLGRPFSFAAVIASSTIAGIFSDLISRDEVRFLNPVFTFYALVAAIALLSCHRYTRLWTVAQEDLRVLAQVQEEMRWKWPSAGGSINTFQRMYQLTVSTLRQMDFVPEGSCTLTAEQAGLLGDVDSSLCRMWDVLMHQTAPDSASTAMPMDDFDIMFQQEAAQSSGGIGEWLFWGDVAFGAG